MSDQTLKPGTLHWHWNERIGRHTVAEWNGSKFIFFNRDFEAREGMPFPLAGWTYEGPVVKRDFFIDTPSTTI